jgi:hypothetical protein
MTADLVDASGNGQLALVDQSSYRNRDIDHGPRLVPWASAVGVGVGLCAAWGAISGLKNYQAMILHFYRLPTPDSTSH